MNLTKLALITTATTFLFVGCAMKDNSGQEMDSLKGQTKNHMPNYPIGL